MSNLTPAQIFCPIATILLCAAFFALLLIQRSSGKTTTVVEYGDGSEVKSTKTTVVKPDLELDLARFVVGLLAALAVFASFSAYGATL